MRKQKTITIERTANDKRDITITELTVKEIRQFWMEEAPKVLAADGRFTELDPFFAKCISGVMLSELDEFTPSEVDLIYTAFKEVNAVFFKVAANLQVDAPMMEEVKMMILRELMRKFVFLFSADTSTSGTTDGASSSPPSSTPTT